MTETDRITISPSGPYSASIRPPGSKSITNRALVCAALADGPSRLFGYLASDDTRVMIESLRALMGDDAVVERDQTLVVNGASGRFRSQRADLWVGNSGTTVRFLVSMLATATGEYRLDGVPRMRQRPIGDLLDALRQLGADVRDEFHNGCPPVILTSNGLAGGVAEVKGDISSQFLSGLLLAAPYAQKAVDLRVIGTLVSRPYVEMTLAVMRSFGVDVTSRELQQFVISPSRYQGCDYSIEPDASAASYFWAAAAVAGGSVTVLGLRRNALQGDVEFVECLRRMGCEVTDDSKGITVVGRKLKGIDVDMNAISDTVQTLAAVALFAQGSTRIRGVAHIRHKETDRIGDLARELRKFGAKVDEHADGLEIHPGPLGPATIETYDDHRMAMSLTLVGLRVAGVQILNPGCTHKTYPQFFQDLDQLGKTAR